MMEISSISRPFLLSNDGQGMKFALNQNKQLDSQKSDEQLQLSDPYHVEQSQLIKSSQLEKTKQLEKLVSLLDEFVSTFNKGLSFRIDEQSGRSVVTVYEVKTGDVIRQIPEDHMLELIHKLSMHANGFIQEKA